MPTTLRVQVLAPNPPKIKTPRSPVPGVTVEAGPVPPDREVTDAASTPASATQKGLLDPEAVLPAIAADADGAFLVPLPDDLRLLVRLLRPGACPIQVALDLRPGKPRFPNGQPRIMTLGQRTARVGQKKVTEPDLIVEWGEPQEVVAASGSDGMFHPTPGIRLNKRTSGSGPQRLQPWCVLTQLRYDVEEKKDQPRVFGLRIDRLLIQSGAYLTRKAVLLTSQPIVSEDLKTALTLYRYVARVGVERPGTVHELGFFNHAWWGGPVLINTGRPSSDCSQACPVDRPHDSGWVDVPRELLRWDRCPFEDEPELRDEAGQERPASARLGLWVTRLGGGGASPHRRSGVHDRDPRNTDFTSPEVLRAEGIDLGAMRAALHATAIVRVWGCNNGPMGERFRAAARLDKSLAIDSPNALLNVKTSYAPSHGDHYTQSWATRRGDLRLGYASLLRRCYAQAVAAGLQRPCYAAIPGSWGWFEKKDLDGGMNVQEGHHDQVVGFARKVGLVDTPEDPDFPSPSPARYHRFDPTPPKVKVPLTVLVTGFVPFRGAKSKFPTRNSASDVVGRLKQLAVLAHVAVPPWVELELTLVARNDVDVVWTCDAKVRDQKPPSAGRPAAGVDGSRGILDLARAHDAAIVVIVGETATLSLSPTKDLRIEGYARNHGKGADVEPELVDNAGRALETSGPIFLGPKNTPRDARLRTSVPLRAWAAAMAAVRRAGLTPEPFESWSQAAGTETLVDIGTTTGEYLCNEAYYRLLLDAHGTNEKPLSDGSGRWVSMVHIPAFDFTRRRPGGGTAVFESVQLPEARLARAQKGLEALVGSFVESMLWAVDLPGRKRKLIPKKKPH